MIARALVLPVGVLAWMMSAAPSPAETLPPRAMFRGTTDHAARTPGVPRNLKTAK